LGLALGCGSSDTTTTPPRTQTGVPSGTEVAGTGAAGAKAGGAAGASTTTTRPGSTSPTSPTSPTGMTTPPAIQQPATGGAPLAAAGSGSVPVSGAGQAAPPTAGAQATGPIDPMIANPAPKPSAGCGKPAPMAGAMATIDVMGTSREYIMALPKTYDMNKPYKLIFAWHGLGGTAMQVASNWYGLSRMANDSSIFVAGQGLETSNSVGSGPGWPNTNGQDVNFVKTLYAYLQANVCFDENRVFSVGMSYGGIMSNTLGCQMGDVFRAIAPMSGSGPGYGGRANCVGQVAVWMSHGDMDTTVPTKSGEASRDFWANANHCQMSTAPVDPSPCVEYAGCDPDLPVTFCEFSGGHTIPPFASAAIWKFFSLF
jgi:poly(3-hydroxybutyrate) depolymerase